MNKPLLNLCRLHLYQTLTLLYGTWKKIALTADDRLAVGAHLCKQELKSFVVSLLVWVKTTLSVGYTSIYLVVILTISDLSRKVA